MSGSKYDDNVRYAEYCRWCVEDIGCTPAKREIWYMLTMRFGGF